MAKTVAKGANDVYVKLKDKSTSFHDISQGKNVVSDRIVLMKRTSKVAQALHHKVLLEVEDGEAEAYFSSLEKGTKKKNVVNTTEDDDDAPPAKKAANAKPTGDKATAAKKDKKDLTADDDE